MSHRVVFTPEALDQIASLYQYIAVAASPGIALDYTEAIVSYCESLSLFPNAAQSTHAQIPKRLA